MAKMEKEHKEIIVYLYGLNDDENAIFNNKFWERTNNSNARSKKELYAAG